MAQIGRLRTNWLIPDKGTTKRLSAGGQSKQDSKEEDDWSRRGEVTTVTFKPMHKDKRWPKKMLVGSSSHSSIPCCVLFGSQKSAMYNDLDEKCFSLVPVLVGIRVPPIVSH